MILFPAILLRLVLALLLGALVGWERESREHAAGMRTNALVALGSALFTIISAYGFADLLGAAHVQLDPTRIASYIVAGIGFLGGGVIFVQRGGVRGLTTAAAIWVVAAIGMACGAGLLWEAIVTTLLSLAILLWLRALEVLILPRHLPRQHVIHLAATDRADPDIEQVRTICQRHRVTIEQMAVHTDQQSETLKLTCLAPSAEALLSTVHELRALPGVCTVHADLQGIPQEDVP